MEKAVSSKSAEGGIRNAPSSIFRPTEAYRSSNKLTIIGEVTPEDRKNDDTGSYRYDVLVLLFFVGLITGVLNGSVLWTCKLISIAQSRLITSNRAGPVLFIFTTAIFCTVSATVAKMGKRPAAIGSGIPEAKSLMVNDCKASDFPRTVSLKILCLRITSLLFAAGSSLSVGVQGPLVHAAVCTAYCLTRSVPSFQSFLDNPAVMKQIFAASAAVGLATVFNAPVGGLLFSVEVTSTYYLISNYWRSFMAASTGAVMYSIFLIDRSQSSRIFEVDYVKDTYHQWELPLFMLLGAISGILTFGFAIGYQKYIVTARRTLKEHPIITAGAAGAITALLVYLIHAYSNNGVSVSTIVHDAFKDCTISTMGDVGSTSRIGGLFASLFVRMFTTLIGTTLQISCGLFMPMLTIGSLIGRIFGQIVYDMSIEGQNIYVAGYAMVGAAAFVSGTTHTISAAVIVIEMTGQINMLLPCLLGSVIACGLNKAYKLSLYDQGMVNKHLESFELLLLTGAGFTQVMDANAVSVTHTCQVADLFIMLETGKQEVFPVIDEQVTGKLIGSINRRDVFLFIKALFEKQHLASYIRHALHEDTKVDDAITQQKFLKESDAKKPKKRFPLIAKASQHLESLGKNIMEMRPLSRTFSTSSMNSNSSHSHNSPTKNAATLEEARRYAAETGSTSASASARTSVNVSIDGEGDLERGGGGNYLASTLASAAVSASVKSAKNNAPGGAGTLTSSTSTSSLASLASTTSSSVNFNPMNDSSSNSSAKNYDGASLTPAATQVVESLLELGVDLAKEAAIPVNIFPFTVQEHTTMDQLYVLFEMVKVDCVFVVRDDGRLRGMINKDMLLETLRQKVQ